VWSDGWPFEYIVQKRLEGPWALFYRRNKGPMQAWPHPFTLKRILRQKKNYGNSNISPCKNIPNLQKQILKKEIRILRDIIITL
jgi:hypothetical protein